MNSISEREYVCWVQRSLNRLINARLKVDGEITAKYRDRVKDFQALSPTLQHYCDSNGIKNSKWGKVDEATQNCLVEWNATMYGYTRWIQSALGQIGLLSGLPTGELDVATLKSIQAFQKQQKLVVDGWVGAKTETALIKASGMEPPQWEVEEARPWHGNAPWKQWCNRFIAEILREFETPTRMPYLGIAPEFRAAYRCVLYKLTYQPGTFHGYLTPYWVQQWIWQGRDKEDLKVMMSPALKEMQDDFMRSYHNVAYKTAEAAQKQFESDVVELMRKIDAGRDRINYANSVLGDLGHVRALFQFWQQAEGDSRTLYSCFRGNLKQEVNGPWSPSVPDFMDILAKVRAWANSK